MVNVSTVLVSGFLLWYHEAQKVYTLFPGVSEQPSQTSGPCDLFPIAAGLSIWLLREAHVASLKSIP